MNDKAGDKVVLITGASSGIGNTLARGLQQHGYRVVGSMRETGGRNREAADALTSEGVHVVELDVCDEESVNAATQEVVDRYGRLDVVINNAGTVLLGPVEAATVEDLKGQFDTNVFGPHRVARACLPHMRRHGHGLIIQLSSGNGRWVLPNMGVYAATKWALEALGEAIRFELSTFGVDCVILELGAHDTQLLKEKAASVSDGEREGVYEELRKARIKDRERHASSASPPQDLVDPVADLISMERGQRPTRVVIHALRDRIERLNGVHAELERDLYQARGLDAFLSNGV